ncbi:MAG: AMP-binding protein [Desulfobacteraceae bacterium]|nr:AMP-binding protein [Desulfobacteraceae bacterium]
MNMSQHFFGIHDIFDRNARLFPNKIATTDRHGTLSFKALFDRVNALAVGLSGLGITKNDRIAVLSMNRNDYLTLYGGAAALGAIVVPINWRLSDSEINYILKDAAPKLLVVDSTQADRCDFTGDQACFDEEGPGDAIPFQALLKEETKPFPPAGNDDPFCLIYTAAVSGTPRGATLSHGNIISSNLQTAIAMALTQNDIYLNMLPLFHITGINLAFSVMQMGGGNVVMEKFDPARALTLTEKEKITLMASFPPILTTLMNTLETTPADLSSLRIVTGIDAPETMRAFTQKTGSSFWALYGQSETSGFATLGNSAERPGSAGREGAISKVAILDENDMECPVDTIGEIGVRGPLVFQGFWAWDKGDLDRSSIANGWHHTGDLGRIDPDGYLWFEGRKPEKELIKPGGENVYPAEVEAVIQEHPDIKECCVIGVPDPKFGEAVKAVCLKGPDSPLTAPDLIEFVGARIARYKKPGHVAFVETLPKDSRGKIDRNRVKALHST